jgi:transcriptional regulator with XRE-family HTH domain
MLSISDLQALKDKVREHGRYRELAEQTGLSESWLSKFATVPGDNYTIATLRKVADYFTHSIHPLRAYRLRHGLSCAELAKALDIAEPTLRSFENGHRVVSAETAVEIERRIGVTRQRLRPELFGPLDSAAKVRGLGLTGARRLFE